jgi:hypothetical protein
MGLFDLFGSKEAREQGALRRLAQKVTQKYGPPENRQKVIQQLGDMGTPPALKVLCMRFTIRADVGISDDEEKEMARQILVDAGEQAVGPVREFLREQESGIAWGLRVLSALVPTGEVATAVVELLEKLGQEYTRDPEKKLVLLSWLQEHPQLLVATSTPAPAPSSTPSPTPTPTVGSVLLPLLEDFSDDVRIGATRVLARLPPSEVGREALLQLLLRDKDNARVRGEVLEALFSLGASVKGHRPAVEELLVEPFFLDREGRVKKLGS